ncbi:probable G-protein coupled receptor 139 [Heterodontus francisci]|uniref:probable G-protein coupled receptor 139 n=1 Tax=Heterodontus francisci TaxID=7792 RepID=UPI00355C123C
MIFNGHVTTADQSWERKFQGYSPFRKDRKKEKDSDCCPFCYLCPKFTCSVISHQSDTWSLIEVITSTVLHVSKLSGIIQKSNKVAQGQQLSNNGSTTGSGGHCRYEEQKRSSLNEITSHSSKLERILAQVLQLLIIGHSRHPGNKSDEHSLHSLCVNLVAIVILARGKCGLSTCTTRYLVAMAMADLLVIITEVILLRISTYYFPGSFLKITPICSVNIVLVCAATDCSVWFTVTFTFDRFVAICCQKLKTKYCTEKTAAVVLATTCILLCLKNIPYYFMFGPIWIMDNVPWFCIIKVSYYTDNGWVGFDWFNKLLTPLLPFALILLLNALTVRHILVASRVRQGLRGQNKRENRSDPKMENRRKSVILLFSISGSFILLWLVHVIHFLYYNITVSDPRDYNSSESIFRQVGWMLRILSCCTNTFIYGVTQSKFREQFKSAVKYPVTSIIQLMNKQYN